MSPHQPVSGSGGGGGGGGGAPTDAEYWVESADATLTNEVVVGTTGITTAAYAARQAAAAAGRLFLPSDGFYLERDTGAAWAPWGPIWPLTAPVNGDFAWINQGTATVNATRGGISLYTPPTAAFSLRCRVKSAPTPPYVITAALNIFGVASIDTNGGGLVWRQSSDGKLVHVRAGWSTGSANWRIYVTKFSDPTTSVANYTDRQIQDMQPIIWLRLEDDNTDRIVSWSKDGYNFREIHSVGRTDYLTADQVGFFGQSGNASYDSYTTLLSWEES